MDAYLEPINKEQWKQIVDTIDRNSMQDLTATAEFTSHSEAELTQLMQQVKRREEEDREFKSLLQLTESDIPPGKSSVQTTKDVRISILMPMRLRFDVTA